MGCAEGPSLFEDAARLEPLEFISYSGDHLWYLIDTLGSGAAAGDYDGDGDPDVLLLSGHAILDEYQAEAATHGDALWRNDGGGKFTDVTREAGLWNPGWSNGAVFGDHDGDGDLDIFVARHGPGLLYRNNGDGTFTERAAEAGVAASHWGAGAVFADLDGDLDLDLYVTNYAHFDIAKEKGKVDWFDKGVLQFPQNFEPEDNVLYRNNGDGTFTDITKEANAQGSGRSLGAVATDVDDDGDLDVFVANDVGLNNLLRNDGGVFKDVALEAGVAGNPEGQFEASMGVAASDYDQDGDIDLIVTNYAGEPNTLYRNEGGGYFVDATRSARLFDQKILDSVGWGVGLHDFDLDGAVDLFVVNGHVMSNMVIWYMRNFYEKKENDIPQMGPEAFRMGASQPRLLYMGKGDGTFEDILEVVRKVREERSSLEAKGIEVPDRFEGRSAGSAITEPIQGRGAAFADFDGDGRLDVAITNKNAPAQVLLNRFPPRGSWTIIDLRAPSPNVYAVGARVSITAGGRTWMREVYAGTSYLSAEDLAVHAGLGSARRIDSVTVRWPGGPTEVFEDLPVDQRLLLRRGEAPKPEGIWVPASSRAAESGQ